jgi:hypothetical protein
LPGFRPHVVQNDFGTRLKTENCQQIHSIYEPGLERISNMFSSYFSGIFTS